MLPKKFSSKNTSQFKGVSFIKKTKLWRARIEVDKKQIFLGDFSTEEQAAKAYNVAAKKYFGELAYQNQFRRSINRRQNIE
jgi:hypothetical protein